MRATKRTSSEAERLACASHVLRASVRWRWLCSLSVVKMPRTASSASCRTGAEHSGRASSMAWPIELQGCLLMFGVVAIAASVAALTLAAVGDS